MTLRPLTKSMKDAFLRRCNELPIHAIKERIDSQEISLDEWRENGLDESKIAEIHSLEIEQEEIRIKKEEDQAFYDEINNDEKTIDEIKNALQTGEVTDQGLLDNTNIDEGLLEKIKGYSQTTNSPENNNVPLAVGTDIFFFGRSGSGKTCVLASIFNYAEDNGLFEDNTISIKGINYKNELVNGICSGVLPDATPAHKDNVTYISTKLIGKDPDGKLTGEESPLNFIEMSGEFFQKAAKDPDSLKDSIDAHGYLSGSNKKLLFFIVDYEMYSEGNNKKVQSQDFQLILQHLDKYKNALKNTASIYIIVNKADKFPEEVVDKDAYALEFFMKNFKSLYVALDSKRKKHKIPLVSMPFSLGSFLFSNSYLSDINQEWPKKLIHSIGNHSDFGGTKPWGLFSSK